VRKRSANVAAATRGPTRCRSFR